MKRAVLSFARQRPDLLTSLPQAELRALVQAGFPIADRKASPGQGQQLLLCAAGACVPPVAAVGAQRLPQLLCEEPCCLLFSSLPQSINAYKRLEATILHGEDLPAGDGGPCDFADVARLLYALAVVDTVTAEMESPGEHALVCTVLTSVVGSIDC